MDTQNKKLEVLNKELENRRGFLGGSGVTNLFINAGVAGLILGQEDSPGEENGTHCSILAWEIP